MGHVVFAAPSIARLHLHERLSKKLLSRGHEVTVLCTDPVALRCYGVHALPVAGVARTRRHWPRLPLDEFAIRDCLLRGRRHPDPEEIRHEVRSLEGLADGLVRFFEREAPDLVLLHQERSGLHRLVHFVAREYGVRVLWTGDGLLPGTQQLDGEGIDGDSSACRRSALEYREQPRDAEFLAASLSAWIAHVLPPPLARGTRHAPGAVTAWLDLGRAWRDHRLAAARRSLRDWNAPDPEPPTPPPPAGPNGEPFLALVLQDPQSARILLDAPAAPSHEEFVTSVAAAATALERDMQVVVVVPERGLAGRVRWRLPPNVQVVSAAHTAVVASTALALVTVNAPAGAGALVAGTPVLHLGRTPYGVPGVARKGCLDTLVDDLRAAIDERGATLRERFLCRILRRDHVWCSADFPDQNGLRGLVLAIELALRERGREGADLRYSPGPTWPLAQTRRLESS